MSDAKSSRLVNLTMALLGKRYVTKSTIFKSVEGYSGTPEAMERMFERDKNDLRDLGITIDLGAFDPLFEDEPGYRILNSDYSLDLGEISNDEIALLALAAQTWKDSSQSESARTGLRKIRSLNDVDEPIEFEEPMISDATVLPLQPQTKYFDDIFQAISELREIVFDYSSARSATQSRRRIHPYGLGSWRGSWYVAGKDLDDQQTKIFKLTRIIGEIRLGKSKNAFTIPQSFRISDVFVMAEPIGEEPCVIKVRQGTCQKLRSMAFDISEQEGFDYLSISGNRVDLLSSILWHGPDAEVISPESLRSSVISLLRTLTL